MKKLIFALCVLGLAGCDSRPADKSETPEFVEPIPSEPENDQPDDSGDTGLLVYEDGVLKENKGRTIETKNVLVDTGAGRDQVFLGGGDDQIFAGPGDDLVSGGGGADFIDGGEGEDTAFYNWSPAGVQVDLGVNNTRAFPATGGDAEGDYFENIENLSGSKFDDFLKGNSGNNRLYGGKGNDSLVGRDGDDILIGDEGDDFMSGGKGADHLIPGPGLDRLDGGEGVDTYYFSSSSGHNLIEDTGSSPNRLVFDHTIPFGQICLNLAEENLEIGITGEGTRILLVGWARIPENTAPWELEIYPNIILPLTVPTEGILSCLNDHR